MGHSLDLGTLPHIPSNKLARRAAPIQTHTHTQPPATMAWHSLDLGALCDGPLVQAGVDGQDFSLGSSVPCNTKLRFNKGDPGFGFLN